MCLYMSSTASASAHLNYLMKKAMKNNYSDNESPQIALDDVLLFTEFDVYGNTQNELVDP